MVRVLLTLLFGMALAVLAMPGVSEAKERVTLAGDDLPYPITTPYEDQEALWNLPGTPVRLPRPPDNLGPEYKGSTWYWHKAVAPERTALEAGVADDALYYPAEGVVGVRYEAETVWLQLDNARNAVLERYVTLGGQGLLPPEPSMIEVVSAAVAFRGEEVSVEVMGRPLDGADARSFWDELALLIRRGKTASHGRCLAMYDCLDISFGLPEGRAVYVRYIRSLGCFCGSPDDLLVRAGFTASPALRLLLEEIGADFDAKAGRPSAGLGADSAGLPLWAIGLWAFGGTLAVAATALVGASRLRRHAGASPG